MPTSRGAIQNALVENPAIYQWKIGRGGQTKRSWQGPQALIIQQANAAQLAGWETVITEGPVWKLEATLQIDLSQNPSGVEPEPEVIWEITGTVKEQPLFDCDRDFVNRLSAKTRDLVEYALKNPEAANQLTSAIIPDPNELQSALKAYYLLRIGVEGKEMFVPVIRRTVTVSRFYSSKWAFANVGKVLSKNALLNNYGVPTNVAELIYQGSTFVPPPDPKTGMVTFSGYLEQFPTYQTAPASKVQISQEWVFNKWSVADNAGHDGMYDVII